VEKEETVVRIAEENIRSCPGGAKGKSSKSPNIYRQRVTGEKTFGSRNSMGTRKKKR
jgi:hypothetical protein